MVRIDINPANGNEMYAVVNVAVGASRSATLGLWRTTNGGSSWSQIATPAGFRASKVYVGFADGGGWQPVGSRTLYLVGRGQQIQVSQNGGSSWQAANVQPQPGRDEAWDRQISDSTNGRPRPELTTSLLPHPTIARRAFAHSKSHNFRTDDAVNWRYSGEGFNGEMPFVGASSIAFSDDPLRMAVAVTNSGYRMTDNGGRSFHVGRVSGYTEANVALKNSCHSVAIHPTDPTLTVISSGFKAAGSEMRLFRSAVRFPGSYVGTRSALGTAAGNSPWVRVRNVNKQTFFLQWNRDTPTVVYEDSVRSLDGGQTWVDYGSGFGGCRAVFPGDHDICYGLTRLTGPERYELRRSNDRGATHSLLANIGWGGVLFTTSTTPSSRSTRPTRRSSSPSARPATSHATTATRAPGGPATACRPATGGAPGRGEPRRSSRSRSTRRTPTSDTSASRALAIHGIWRSGNIQAVSPGLGGHHQGLPPDPLSFRSWWCIR